MNLRWTRPLAGLALVGALTTGCPSPNTYTTPRTIPRGTVQHTLAVEALGAAGSGGGAFLPPLPTYQLRVGIADQVDIGFRLSALSTIGGDVKINLLRSSGFDLSLDPGIQGAYVVGFTRDDSGSLGIVYFNLPVLLGFNLSRNFTLLASPGILYTVFTGGSASSLSGDRSSVSASGIAGRLGVGFAARVNNSFAIQPELTVLFPLEGESSGAIFSLGLGFQFGSQPDHSDIQ